MADRENSSKHSVDGDVGDRIPQPAARPFDAQTLRQILIELGVVDDRELSTTDDVAKEQILDAVAGILSKGIASSSKSGKERSPGPRVAETGDEPTMSLVGSTDAEKEETLPSSHGHPVGSAMPDAQNESLGKRFGDYARKVRSADRIINRPYNRDASTGFRVARTYRLNP